MVSTTVFRNYILQYRCKLTLYRGAGWWVGQLVALLVEHPVTDVGHWAQKVLKVVHYVCMKFSCSHGSEDVTVIFWIVSPLVLTFQSNMLPQTQTSTLVHIMVVHL
jgi:hypothetical protein